MAKLILPMRKQEKAFAGKLKFFKSYFDVSSISFPTKDEDDNCYVMLTELGLIIEERLPIHKHIMYVSSVHDVKNSKVINSNRFFPLLFSYKSMVIGGPG